MKTDFYTKAILTIIALCLTCNVISDMDIIPSAYASGNTLTPEKSSEYCLVPINNTETIDVRIVDINTYNELKVNITSIDTNDEMDINIDEIGGSWVSSGGPINVKIKE
ncbi:MAG TPA: hypothetical protein EYP87_00750 [Flavobacteriaceae bacterium]|nr:hypothetical protein [Flavobacteriaceae bacterium]